MERFSGPGSGRLMVGVTPWITLTFLAEAVQRFRKRLPDIRLELFEGLMAVAQPLLREGSMDFAVGQLQPGASMQEFACEPILTYESSVMVREGHRKAQARSIHELFDEDWVLNFAPDSESNLLDYLFTRHGAQIDERRIVRAQSVAMLQTMVEHADMCTWSPTILSHVPPFGGRLRPLTLREVFEPRQLGIVTRRSSTLSNAAVAFVECLLDVIRRHARSAKKEDLVLFETLKLLI
nr:MULTISPECIES: substrate-binding domain-containing protein [Paraburkholderia]